MTPLILNIFRLIPKPFVEVADLKKINKEELEKRRKRVLALCYVALEEIGDVFNARNPAPEIMQAFTEAGPQDTNPTITGLKAIYIKAQPR